MDDLRAACAAVAARARHVRVRAEEIPTYAAEVVQPALMQRPVGEAPGVAEDPERRAAFWLSLDAINFGSGWFPTLRKRGGLSGYNTIAAAWRGHGPPTASELADLDPGTVADILGQDPEHELMALYAVSLNDLGARVVAEHGGSFADLARCDGGSALALARRLGTWPCFTDVSRYEELSVPFLKRAQIAAADLHRAGVLAAPDLGRLTMFADNLVPHVLRLDGILVFDPELVARIDAGTLLRHGSAEEVEIRVCAVHAVELIVAAAGAAVSAAQVDALLWNQGGEPRYKAVPRHRARCTAY